MHYIGGALLKNYILLEIKNSYPLSKLFANTKSPFNQYVMVSMDAALSQVSSEIQSCKLAYASQYRALFAFSFTGKNNDVWHGNHNDERLSYICSKFTLYFNKVFNYRIEMYSPISASDYGDTFQFAKAYVSWRKDRLALYDMKDNSFFTGTSTIVTQDELKERIKSVQLQDYNRLVFDCYRINCEDNTKVKKKQVIAALKNAGIDANFYEFIGRLGIFIFKAPKLFNEGKDNQTIRNKLTCDRNPPSIKDCPEYLNVFFK